MYTFCIRNSCVILNFSLISSHSTPSFYHSHLSRTRIFFFFMHPKFWTVCIADIKNLKAQYRPIDKITDLREIGSDERLFHSNPDGDRYEQLLIRFFQLISCSWQQLDARQFLAIGSSLFLSVSAQKITCDYYIQKPCQVCWTSTSL